MSTRLYIALLLVALLFWLSACAHDPVLELICSEEPDKQRCIEEHTRK